jgi:transposase
MNETIMRDNRRLRALNSELEQKKLFVNEQLIVLKSKLFGRSSEREPSKELKEKNRQANKDKKIKVQLPSLRYPEAQLIERHVVFDAMPACKCCGIGMQDSGMTEDSEYLTVIPEQFLVIRQMRHKYRCGKCHGGIVTAPKPPKIKEGSSYSDEMVIDVAVSKYCDLLPIERYSRIAGREGMKDIPPQSLIEATHNLSNYVYRAYEKIKAEIKSSKVLHADETPHKMLEGDIKSNWYLWGFSNLQSCYFEIRNTRSGDVASEMIGESSCEYLMSDVFSGYARAVTEANKIRKEKNLPLLKNIYCNAHARRKFKEAEGAFPEEARFFIECYKEIYQLEDYMKGKPPDKIPDKKKLRKEMMPRFTAMKNRAMELLKGYSTKSSLGKALSYFLKNFEEFTVFIKNLELPIDNNAQERLLRNPVIGRKTWYGTHSKQGARTAAILFSIVESCKMNGINPREYLTTLVRELHQGNLPFTPAEFKKIIA